MLASSHRLSRAKARGAHRGKPGSRNFPDASQAARRLHPRDPHARPQETTVRQRDYRLGARARPAAGLRTRPRVGQGYAQRTAQIRIRRRSNLAACDDIRGKGFSSKRLRLSRVRENLHRFFRAARGAGVHVSPAESIDAMRAVAKVGLSDRGILRDALLLTLAKSEDEKKALGACFDLFFAHPEPQQASEKPKDADGAAAESQTAEGTPSQAEGLGPLAQMLLSQDRSAIAAAIASASGAASLSDI